MSVTLTDPSRPEGAMDALRARFPHVLVLALEPEGVVPDERGYRARIAGRDDLSVAAEFVRHVSNAPPTAGEERLLGQRVRGRPAVDGEEADGLMRPHRLRVTAFGAFGGTVEVSFDDLASSGLFLLHGETGAGKTTLLDAIGFALYGRVPGERGKARRLRSDHAAPGTPTEVQLEATLGGRRMRITRKPEQERAKLRGTGTTTEQAKILLEELTGGSWRAVSTRAGEADAEIADLMGMSADQFFQVVLLPQGEFAQVPARRRRRPGQAAAAPVRHRPVPRGRGVARPPPEDHRGRSRRPGKASPGWSPGSPRPPASRFQVTARQATARQPTAPCRRRRPAGQATPLRRPRCRPRLGSPAGRGRRRRGHRLRRPGPPSIAPSWTRPRPGSATRSGWPNASAVVPTRCAPVTSSARTPTASRRCDTNSAPPSGAPR